MTDGTGPFDFALNPDAGIAVHRVGNEDEPVIVVDRVLRSPERMVDYAASEVAFVPCAAGGYPGVRAPAPLGYVQMLARQLDPLIRQTFRLTDVTLSNAECSFSIVTTPPEALTPIQCIPHTDTSYGPQFAVLHYLCRGEFGGTGFFRHNATGIEVVNEGNEARYRSVRDRELLAAPPAGYPRQSSPGYICTGAFEALFDRLVVYRSSLLHCGLIPPGMPLTPDPRRSRLTANIFVTYLAGQS